VEKTQMFLQKWRVRLGHMFGIVVVVFARPHMEWLLAGTTLALAGEAIRVYSSGCIRKDTALSMAGPYAFTRNPLYVGSFLMYLGFCIAAANWIVLAVYFPFFFITYYATIFREEMFLRGVFKDAYNEYCKAVPRFFPRFRRLQKSADGLDFSFAQVMKNREYEAAIAIVIILALLWVMGLTGKHLAL
jgi:protein-S-isoprenylcysteine O-methyltransferase Ste14